MIPILWMRAVRDAIPPFSAGSRAALWALALRMNADGSGAASTRQLKDDAAVGQRTVERAISDARRRAYLLRTRRGHRLGNGKTLASEWLLLIPQPATSDGASRVNGRSAGGSQPATSQPANTQPQPANATSQPAKWTSQPATGGTQEVLDPGGLRNRRYTRARRSTADERVAQALAIARQLQAEYDAREAAARRFPDAIDAEVIEDGDLT